MTQYRPENSPESTDPRLLLPEWLRDPEATAIKSDPDLAPAPVVESELLEPSPAPHETTRARWPEPPPRRSIKLDPAALIRPDQLPPWIRQLAQVTETPPRTSPDERPVPAQATLHITELTTAPMLSESGEISAGQPGDDRIPVGESDLTRLRFALIAGATFVLLLAALALAFA